MPEEGIPTKIIRLLSSFLTNRHLRVHQDNAVSNKIELKAGTPQGSELSPLLFIFYVNDTPKPSPGVFTSKFADDMAAWAIQKQEKRVATDLCLSWPKVLNLVTVRASLKTPV